MQIDSGKERLMRLFEAAQALPVDERGNHPSVWTLRRWAKHGVNEEYLETVRMGRVICTSMEALGRFFVKLQEAEVETATIRKRGRRKWRRRRFGSAGG